MVALAISTLCLVGGSANALQVGDRAQVVTPIGVNIRISPGTCSACTVVGGAAFGSTGTIIAGPQFANGSTWWQIDWDAGGVPTGWSAEGDATETWIQAITSSPIVSSVSPNPLTGSNSQQTLTIFGSNFVSGAALQVRLREPAFGVDSIKSGADVTWVSSSQIQVQATFGTDPSSTWTAQVINPGGAVSGQFSFSVQAPVPAITSLSPSSRQAGSAGFTLTVNGSTFHQGSIVRWNGANRTTTPVCSGSCGSGSLVTALQATISASDVASAGIAQVTVYSSGPGGGTSSSASFTVTAVVPVPSVSSVSPTAMTANDVSQLLTINGSSFSSGNIVQFFWGVGAGSGVWNTGISTPTITSGQITISMNPGTVNDTIYVRVCRSVSATTTSDCSSGTHAVAVTAATAVDVQPLNVTRSSSSVVAAGSLSVNWQIRNNGTGAAGTSNSQVRISASSSSYGNSSNNVGSPQATGSIGAGATINQSTTVTVPTTPGTYYVWVIADNNSALTQTNTNNDFAVSAAFVVTVGAPGALTLSNDPPFWDDRPPAGPAVQLRWTLSSNATTYEVYRDGAKIFPTSGTFFSERTFRNEIGLNSGQTYDYYIIARNSAGWNQSNTISVGPMPGPQLVPNVYSVSPSMITQGNSYRDVAIAGSDFTASSWHQFSSDGGVSWVPAQSAPVINGTTSMTVGVNDTVVRTVLIRVCASFGRSACSGSVSVTTQASPAEITPQVTSVLPNAIPIGSGSQNVTLIGAAFAAANRYQESTDSGNTWVWAVTVPTINSPTSMSVAVDDTVVGTVRLRVCSSQGSVACSGSVAVTVQPAIVSTPTITAVFPATIPEGAGLRNVTISGIDFGASNWHQYSLDAGSTWGWAQSAPTINGTTSMGIAVNDTIARTMLIRVCSSFGSSACSGSASLTVTPEVEPPQLGATCGPSGCASSSTKAVVITHGYNATAFDWPLEMANAVCESVGVPQYSTVFQVDSFIRVCSSGGWDVWLVDWSTEASVLAGGFLPPAAQTNAARLGYETATYFLENHQYQHYHLIAHSAGAQLIDNAAKALMGTATVHQTFLDAYDQLADQTLAVTTTRHISKYGEKANWVDSYVDTRPVVFGLNQDKTDLHLPAGFNIDVTPESTGCLGSLTCPHSRPYRFYIKSIDSQYPDDPIDPIQCPGNTMQCPGDMGYPLSMEAGSSMNLLTLFKGLECRMGDDGTCTPVPWSPGWWTFFLGALGETSIDAAVGTVDFVKSVSGKLYDRLELITNAVLPLSSTGSLASATATTSSDDPAYISVKLVTAAPANVLRFNWAFDTQGQGLLHVYVDGELVSQIDQRFVAPTSIETEEVSIGGAAGTLAPGTHEIAFRLDGFGVNPSGLELTEVELGLLQITDPNAYNVAPSAGTGGSVNPNLPQSVAAGGTASFVATANSGFVPDPRVTGTCPQGGWNGNTWTTGTIFSDCTVNFGFDFDTDGDGIPDDGDGSGTVGDSWCIGGNSAGCDDNCPGVWNPGQADGGGLGAGSGPDGVGDDCQCGDVNRDTRVTSTDATILFNEARGNPTGALLAPELADVNGNGLCTTGDATILFNFLRGVPGASIPNRCFDPGLTCP